MREMTPEEAADTDLRDIEADVDQWVGRIVGSVGVSYSDLSPDRRRAVVALAREIVNAPF